MGTQTDLPGFSIEELMEELELMPFFTEYEPFFTEYEYERLQEAWRDLLYPGCQGATDSNVALDIPHEI